MISVSSEFKRQVLQDNRNYIITVDMTLDDGTNLTLTNENLWDSGVRFEESTSSESSFDIGSAVIGECVLTINNIYRIYDVYDFYNATFSVEIGLMIDDEPEMIRRGFFTVDEATYNGSLITLKGLDNMWKFDVPFSEVTVTYPTTAQALVLKLCQHCGVALLNSQFDKYTTVIPQPLSKIENMNCREILSYIAQMCCCFCKIDPDGYLKLVWYNSELMTSIQNNYYGGVFDNDSPYSTGDDIDGGSFSPWNTGDVADGGVFEEWFRLAYLTSNSRMEVATDDTLITGIQVVDKDKENGYDYTYGTDDYCIIIENNPFIVPSNAQAIATQIGSKAVGMKFRAFSASSLNDVSYESGDVCVVKDFRGDVYFSYITNLTFQQWNYEHFSCGAETVSKNKTIRYSESVTNAIKQARADAVEQISSYDLIVQQMNKLASNSMGLFFFEYKPSTGGSIMYQSNRPINEQSDGQPSFSVGSKVWKHTGDGFFICTDARPNDSDCTWVAGWDSDNNVVVNTLSAIGINFDWAHGGTLTLGGDGNINGSLRVLSANGTQIAKMDKDGFESKATNDRFESMSSLIEQNAEAIVLKVSKGDVSSEISAEAGQVHISSNRFVLDATNCSISANGTITAKNCTLSGTLRIGNTNNLIEIGNSTISMGSSSSTITVGGSSGITISSTAINIGGTYGIKLTNSSIEMGYMAGSLKITSSGITMGNSTLGVEITTSQVKIGSSYLSVVLTSSSITLGSSITIADNSIKVGSIGFQTSISSSEIDVRGVKISSTGLTVGTSGTFVRNTESTLKGTFRHDGSSLGFFGHSASYKTEVSTLYSSATLSDVISKVNSLINALDSYGLV